jgi:hypothetical protein
VAAELPFLKLNTHSNNNSNAHKIIAHYAELLGISNTRVDNFKELLAGLATLKPNWKLKPLGRCDLVARPSLGPGPRVCCGIVQCVFVST